MKRRRRHELIGGGLVIGYGRVRGAALEAAVALLAGALRRAEVVR